jgi:hypothetical protein
MVLTRWELALEFGSHTPARGGPGAYVARVPAGIRTARALLSTISEALKFPEYFGLNWNALSDSLRDLHWMHEREVVLAHDDLPPIEVEDQRIYLDVLAEAVESWKPQEEHRLRVVFPEASKDEVLRLRPASGTPH